jgi:hypothetical protein
MQALRTKLLGALTAQFDRESESAIARLKDGVSPYTRFVRAEHERIAKAQASLADLRQRLSVLHARAQSVVG